MVELKHDNVIFVERLLGTKTSQKSTIIKGWKFVTKSVQRKNYYKCDLCGKAFNQHGAMFMKDWKITNVAYVAKIFSESE